MSNTTRKYIFTEYWSSIIQYLNGLLRSLKVKSVCAIKLFVYGFLLMFYCNIGSNLGPFQDIRVRNLGNLAFELSRPLKVKCEGAIGLPIYGFLFMFNSYI